MDPLTVMLIGAALAIPSGAFAILLATAIQHIFAHRRRPGVVVIVVNEAIASRNARGDAGEWDQRHAAERRTKAGPRGPVF